MSKLKEKSLHTQTAIVAAFWELYKEKPINKITVKDVTDKAGLYRSTLYYYLEDVYAILEFIEAEILQDWEDTIADIFTEGYDLLLRGNVRHVLPKIEPFYKRTGEYITVLLGPSGDPQFQQKIKDTLRKRIFSMFEISETHLEAQIIFEACCSAMLAVFVKWYSDDAPLDQIAETFQKIVNPQLFQTMLSYSSNPLLRMI